MRADTVDTRAAGLSVCESGKRIESLPFAMIVKTEVVIQSDSESRSTEGGSEASDCRVMTAEETKYANIDPGAPVCMRGRVIGPRMVRA